MLSFQRELNRVRADLTSLKYFGQQDENEAQRSVEAILISRGRYCSLLSRKRSHSIKDAETEINPWVSMAHNGSLQHVSKCLSLLMNIKKYIRVNNIFG